jgi:hypothetical protein
MLAVKIPVATFSISVRYPEISTKYRCTAVRRRAAPRRCTAVLCCNVLCGSLCYELKFTTLLAWSCNTCSSLANATLLPRNVQIFDLQTMKPDAFYLLLCWRSLFQFKIFKQSYYINIILDHNESKYVKNWWCQVVSFSESFAPWLPWHQIFQDYTLLEF